jgi:hypothetical protein
VIHTYDRPYDTAKPPILLVQRRVEYVCSVCKKPGMGPPNARVHPGRCRDAYTIKRAAERMLKAKTRKALARAVAAEEGECSA